MVHQIEHELFQDHAQSAGTDFAGHGLARYCAQSIFAEFQADVLELEQPLILLDDGVLGTSQDVNQRRLIQLFEHPDHRHAADELRDQAKLDQVLRLHVSHQFGLLLLNRSCHRLGFFLARLETQRLPSGTPPDNLVQPYEGATANKEDVGGVHGSEFLVRMLASALRGNIGNRSLQNLQEGTIANVPPQ